jgi:hypothetical protein
VLFERLAIDMRQASDVEGARKILRLIMVLHLSSRRRVLD